MTVNLTRLPLAQQHSIKALLEAGASIRKAAKLSGVCNETVLAIKRCKSLDLETVERIKKGLGAKFYDVADRSLDSITDDKLKHSSASQLVMTAAVATDKARLIEGKATQRTEFVDATDRALEEEISGLEAQLASMGASGDVVDVGSEEVPAIPVGQQAPQSGEAA